MRLASRENISASLASLTRREKCDILWSLGVSQFARLANKQNHNSLREISVRRKVLARFRKTKGLKLVMILASLTTKLLFARLATKFVCETHEKRVLLRNFFPRDSLQNFFLRDSQEANLATIFDSRVSRESRKNFGSKKRVSPLARISKSDSRVNPTGRTLGLNHHQETSHYCARSRQSTQACCFCSITIYIGGHPNR
jgi:hypothetical protein